MRHLLSLFGGRLSPLPVVAGMLLFLGCGSDSSPTSPSGSQAPAAPTPTPKPLNVILIVTDDQDTPSARDMPKLASLITAEGVTFQNAIATTPLCGPSRATLLTGRYAHSHGIRGHHPPLGGYALYRDSGVEADSLPVWLKNAGYRNAYMGKYTNGYGAGWGSAPPGWDEWVAFTEPHSYFNFSYNENGRDLKVASGGYQTDFLTEKALDFLRRTEERDDQPFFLVVMPWAPHNRARPAARHSALFPSRGAPRTPAFDEADVSDKPRHIRRIGRYTSAVIGRLDDEYRNKLRSLMAVDEMIEKLVQALTAQGELENTAIIFTSDNGLSTGAHRFWDKTAPYAESLDIPMYIRVPGGAKGVTLPHLVGNIDIAATVLDWAKVSPPASIEGRSLTPLLSPTPPAIASWRADLLIEFWDTSNPSTTFMPTYQGVRVENGIQSLVYVHHVTDEEEFYDFKKDPYQLDSAVNSNPQDVGRLRDRVRVLAACSGANCR